VPAGDAIVDEAARTKVCNDDDNDDDDDDDDKMDEDGADVVDVAELLRACLRDSGASSESLDWLSGTSAVVRFKLRLAVSRDLISSASELTVTFDTSPIPNHRSPAETKRERRHRHATNLSQNNKMETGVRTFRERRVHAIANAHFLNVLGCRFKHAHQFVVDFKLLAWSDERHSEQCAAKMKQERH
jgi:hypothetical protein